ncbi:caspase-1 [Oryctolagus cuniculus]|uniref:caspase-1 n=1 Tax=Oryctolagus cuniculus TaxID=9986 RepID=UPI002230E025|nr:caspase-1 [Oryctolagus cuniculus]XP_051676142.1 caspase-1 [Oryctolagus cuniculus]XP_051676145.1 caspase-1 [Oryctolagus cuniculus]XP_051676147.1 caspase-1 [Oryctolagus cuniculus]XP_051676152.1 caspase-1 [Oryctolagus cuniculus]
MADKRLKEKRKLFVDSVSEDTLHSLLDDVLHEKVLNQEEIEKVKKGNIAVTGKARDLIDSVIPKGSRACQVFIDHICQRDSTLAYKLGFSSETLAKTHARTDVPSAEPPGTLKLCPRENFLKLRRTAAGKIYPIREKGDRTRMALIICNTEFDHLPRRNGSTHDIKGMKGVLEALDYRVDVKENLTAKATEKVLRTFASWPEHRNSDSTFLVFMSHGVLDGFCGVEHQDEKPDVLPYDTVFQIFNNCNCSHLKDKPKVIIIQACRGANSGEAWVSDSQAGSVKSPSQSPLNLTHDGVNKTHVEKDFVAFYSSTPHNVSWRSPKGSFFITKLIDYVQTYAWDCHLTEIFMKVQQSFENPNVKVQMPSIDRQTLTRHFYLFPGN